MNTSEGSIQAVWQGLSKGSNIKRFSLDCQTVSSLSKQSYRAQLGASLLRVEADSPQTMLCAVERLQRGLKSSFVSELLGSHSLQYSQRFLKIRGGSFTAQDLFERLSGLPYNGLILPERHLELPDLQKVFEGQDMAFYAALGLPKAEEVARLSAAFPFIKGFVLELFYWEDWSWESAEKTQEELLLGKLQEFEGALLPGQQLILVLKDSEEGSWLNHLDFLHQELRTNICFVLSPEMESAWALQRRSPFPWAQRFLGSIDFSSDLYGRGCWPLVPWASMDRCFGAMSPKSFKGSIAEVDHLPEKGSFLASALWAQGQMHWEVKPSLRWAELFWESEGQGWGQTKLQTYLQEVFFISRRFQDLKKSPGTHQVAFTDLLQDLQRLKRRLPEHPGFVEVAIRTFLDLERMMRWEAEEQGISLIPPEEGILKGKGFITTEAGFLSSENYQTSQEFAESHRWDA